MPGKGISKGEKRAFWRGFWWGVASVLIGSVLVLAVAVGMIMSMD